MPAPKEEQAAQVETAFNSTLETIQREAKQYENLAHTQRSRYSWAKMATVVLGVLTPTVVTFQTQQSLPQFQFALGIGAIALTAFAGIVTGLQAAFRWGEGYARWTGTGLALSELAISLELESRPYKSTTDADLKKTKLDELYEKAIRQRHLIMRKHTEAEIASVTDEKRLTIEGKSEITKSNA